MVLTSCDKLGDSGKQTGWYLPECAHPYAAFKAAGFNMTFASPKGGLAPVDEGSVNASKEDKGCMDFHTGEDFDQRVMEYMMKIFKRKHKKDMSKDKRSIQKLRREVERAKRALSSTAAARIEIEALFDGTDFSETL